MSSLTEDAAILWAQLKPEIEAKQSAEIAPSPRPQILRAEAQVPEPQPLQEAAVAQMTFDVGASVLLRLGQLELENEALRQIATSALERAEQVEDLKKLSPTQAPRRRSFFDWLMGR